MVQSTCPIRDSKCPYLGDFKDSKCPYLGDFIRFWQHKNRIRISDSSQFNSPTSTSREQRGGETNKTNDEGFHKQVLDKQKNTIIYKPTLRITRCRKPIIKTCLVEAPTEFWKIHTTLTFEAGEPITRWIKQEPYHKDQEAFVLPLKLAPKPQTFMSNFSSWDNNTAI